MEYLSKEMKKKFMSEGMDWKAKELVAKKNESAAARKLKLATLKQEKEKAHVASKEDIKVLLAKLKSDIINNPITTVKGLFMKAKKDPTLGKKITMQDVQDFWRGTEDGQVKDMTSYNSWVGSLPREQYHLDIAYITKAKKKGDLEKEGGFIPDEEAKKDQNIEEDKVEELEPEKKGKKGLKNIPEIYGKFAKAFIAIDVFSKKVSVTPVDGTTPDDAVKGMQKAVQQLGFPKEVYVDDGGEFKGAFAKYCAAQGIKIIVTRRHAMFAERFTRYFRWHLRIRQRAYGGDWGVWAQEVVKNYNKGTEERPTHATTKMSPEEAHEDKNALDVKLNLVMEAKHNRSYPPIKEGDKVKIHQKKTRGEEKKEIVPLWSPATFTVENITFDNGTTYYTLDPRPVGLKAKYLRHELLLVS